MALYFGYDPGGENNHGVAVLEISDGRIRKICKKDCVADVMEAMEFFKDFPKEEVEAIGVDTLLLWSKKGKRSCDVKLKEKYQAYENSVMQQNSIRSAMTLSGIMLAHEICQMFPSIKLCESHPKLLSLAHHRLLAEAGLPEEGREREKDHVRDAIIAAWAASKHSDPVWKDLYKAEGFREPEESLFDPLCNIGNEVSFPWPLDVDHDGA